MFLPALGSFGILDPSDGLYAEGAREMLESGNFLTPAFNYTPFLEKPILVYWLIALCFKLFGVSEFSARLPAAIAAIVTCCCTYLSTRTFLTRRAAFYGSVLTMSNVLFAFTGHLALVDMELTCFATIAALYLFLAIDSESKKKSYYLGIAYALLSLTILLKGPVMLVVTGLSLLVNYLLLRVMFPAAESKPLFQYLWNLQPLFGICTIIILGAPWFIIENSVTHGAFFQEFFVRQNIGRIAGTVNHLEAWWFYMPIVIGMFVPWIFMAPLAVQWLRKVLRQKRPLTMRAKLTIFCLSWAAINFILFSAIPTKLPTYILPIVPLSSLIIGIFLDATARQRFKGRRLPVSGIVITWYAIMAILVPTFLVQYYKHKDADFRDLVDLAGPSNLATFWRDSPAAVFYHHKKVFLVMTVEDLQNYLKTKGKPHLIIVTRDLIPFLKLEAKNPKLVSLRTKGNFAIFDVEQ
jgi:4-amino-4-deoxy-L-arabinose transferase-like glycosyltransferase